MNDRSKQTMTGLDVLKAARALVDSPEKWIKGSLREGGCFCTVGAVDQISPDLTINSVFDLYNNAGIPDPHFKALQLLTTSLPEGFKFVYEYNDNPETTHADIMTLFDRAIERGEDEK